MRQKTILLSLAALAAPAFLFLWEQVQATRLGYQVSAARTEVRRARERVAYLRLELERLNAPESVAEAARRRLRMGPPLPESVVVLGAPRLAPVPTAVPKRPAPAPAPLLASAIETSAPAE
ncbi:MAG: hypothetical protein HYZ75_10210 [Elusimicrobia bacterium]|nr:hypothetical protein [Elusimicrobiota bacterium]